LSRYQKLREAYSAYKDSENQFCRENERLAEQIVSGLHGYLGMPETFETENDIIRYISYYLVDEQGEAEEVPFLREALTHVTDGSFRFGIGLMLERAAAVLPKQNLIMTLQCRRKAQTALISVAEKEVECQFDGAICPDVDKVHGMVFERLMAWLKHRPGDEDEQSKIGFRLIR
jgi:hypothetical protein